MHSKGGSSMWCFEEGFAFGPLFGGLWTLIFGGGLIALIIWGITRLTRQNSSTSTHNALDVVKERYAKRDWFR